MKSNHPFDAAPRVCVRRVEGGYVAEGPGFYVWDEDRLEVERAARELSRGSAAIPPTRRMLRIPLEPDVLVGS